MHFVGWRRSRSPWEALVTAASDHLGRHGASLPTALYISAARRSGYRRHVSFQKQIQLVAGRMEGSFIEAHGEIPLREAAPRVLPLAPLDNRRAGSW